MYSTAMTTTRGADLDRIVERLAAGRDREFASGKEHGQRWAAEQADYRTLNGLSRFFDNGVNDDATDAAIAYLRQRGPACLDWPSCDMFEHGFLQSALDFWDAIEDRI